jgi:hypothetical protein
MQSDPEIPASDTLAALPARPQAATIIVMEPLAVPIEQAPQAAGVARTRIFDAIAKSQLTARKAGKATIIEIPELRRWIRSLPTRGRAPDPANAVRTPAEDQRPAA